MTKRYSLETIEQCIRDMRPNAIFSTSDLLRRLDDTAKAKAPKTSDVKVIESPLKSSAVEGFLENIRFLLWCMRAEYEAGFRPIASHLNCPFFMNDDVKQERDDGIGWIAFWRGDAHSFYYDLGGSSGMGFGRERCFKEGIYFEDKTLEKTRPDLWEQFVKGHWPPHTRGFKFAPAGFASLTEVETKILAYLLDREIGDRGVHIAELAKSLGDLR